MDVRGEGGMYYEGIWEEEGLGTRLEGYGRRGGVWIFSGCRRGI